MWIFVHTRQTPFQELCCFLPNLFSAPLANFQTGAEYCGSQVRGAQSTTLALAVHSCSLPASGTQDRCIRAMIEVINRERDGYDFEQDPAIPAAAKLFQHRPNDVSASEIGVKYNWN